MKKEMEDIKTAALNVPLKDIRSMIDKWEWVVKGGVNDVELLALYFFYADLEKKIRILCPEYLLAYKDMVRKLDGISQTLWARFPSDMPDLIG